MTGGAAEQLARQRAAQAREGAPSLAERLDRLDRAIVLLREGRTSIEAAMDADYGGRPRQVTALAEVAGAVAALKHARARTRGWTRPRRLPTSPGWLPWIGGRLEVRPEPKGVIGVLSPWNFPVNLCFSPLAGVFAAGNRALVKMPELTPRTSALVADLVERRFDPTELSVVLGDAEVAQAFCALPFDHLMFTGSTAVGRAVMRAAADNLTPVTLELGGKCPAYVSRSADLPAAARSLLHGKTLNAGQVCLAPDYVLLPEERLEAFIAAARRAFLQMYPGFPDSADYGAIVSDRHLARLEGLLADAESRGARLERLAGPAALDSRARRRLAPVLVIAPPEGARLNEEEIFGPVLVIHPYADAESAARRILARPKPLALYYFGRDRRERERLLRRAPSGGVTLNDVILHGGQEAAPFGGLGASGMGAYHGARGFQEFSHARTVFHAPKGPLDPFRLTHPPYGPLLDRVLGAAIGRASKQAKGEAT